MVRTRLALGMSMGLLALARSPAFAGEPARSMAALEARIQPGTEVDVVDRQGRIVRGSFVRADDEGVLVTPYGGAEGRRVPAGDVMNVTRPGDSLKNGALIGAGIGLIGAAGAFLDDTGTGCYDNGCRAGWGVLSVAIYTGVGVLIDRAIKGRDVVYRAPAGGLSWSVTPHPVSRGATLRLAVTF